MQELMKDIDTAFKMISTVSVSGESVDMIAGARAKLRGVYAKLKEMDEQNNRNQTEVQK